MLFLSFERGVAPQRPRLCVGIESTFGSAGTYLQTGDVFGMTGGNAKNMTTASSPEEDGRKFFDNYGDQIYNTGNDPNVFINALQHHDFSRFE